MKNRFVCSPLILILFSLLLFACGDRPSYVLDEDEMVNLIVDMEIAESYSNMQTGGNRSNKQKVELGRRVLAAHGITPDKLDTSLAWYGRNLDEYSKLFEKVDKELQKRKDLYVENDYEKESDLDNLWPFNQHLIISPLSGHESLIISLLDPPVQSGERLNLSFSLPNRSSMKGLWGVDYSDGTSEAITSTFNNKAKVESSLLTDTAKTVSRIFGVFTVKDKKELPVYIDSLKITTMPFDTLEYRRKKRTQKTYGVMLPKPKPIVQKDSLKTDTVPVDSIKTDSIKNRRNDSIQPRPPKPLERPTKHK